MEPVAGSWGALQKQARAVIAKAMEDPSSVQPEAVQTALEVLKLRSQEPQDAK